MLYEGSRPRLAIESRPGSWPTVTAHTAHIDWKGALACQKFFLLHISASFGLENGKAVGTILITKKASQTHFLNSLLSLKTKTALVIM